MNRPLVIIFAHVFLLFYSFQFAPADETRWPLLASFDFEDGPAAGFEPKDAAHWRVLEQEGSFVYELTVISEQGKVRAPASWSLLAGHDVTSFVLSGRMKCAADPANTYRDLCVFPIFRTRRIFIMSIFRPGATRSSTSSAWSTAPTESGSTQSRRVSRPSA